MAKIMKKIFTFAFLTGLAVLSACSNADIETFNIDVDKDSGSESNVINENELGQNEEDIFDDIIGSNDENSSTGIDENLSGISNINSDMTYGVVHTLGSSYVSGMIRNKYAQISTISGDSLEASKVNLRYIFELDTTDRDLSLYTVKIELNIKHSRSDYIIRTIGINIDKVYNGYYSDGNLITKDNTCYVVYTLTNIPYNSWDYDFDVNCLIISEDEEESADASNNVLSVLVEENNEILDTGFAFVDEDNDECVLTEYTGNGKKIVIPDRKIVTEYDEYTEKNYSYYKGVTSIGDDLLRDNKTVETIIIPDGITKIGDNAFSGCESLVEVQMPNTVTKIGENAFYGCDSLNKLVLSKNVTSIGENAFSTMPSILYYGGKNNEVRNVIANTFNDDNINWYYKTYNSETVDSSGNHWYYEWNGSDKIVAKTYYEVTLKVSDEEKTYEYIAENDTISLDDFVELEDRYFIGWYLDGALYDEKQKITSDITIDAKWVYSSISAKDEFGYEIYDLDLLDIETIDLTRNNGYMRIVSISNKSTKTSTNNITKTIILPNSIKKCSDYAFAKFTNIENVYYDGDENNWCEIRFEGKFANPAFCETFKNFYVRRWSDNNYERITKLNLTLIEKIGDYQFFNMTQINEIVVSNYLNYIGYNSFGAYSNLNYADNTFIERVYGLGIAFDRNKVTIMDDDYNNYGYYLGYYNRLANVTKWYKNSNPEHINTSGDYWYEENGKIYYDTYYEIIIHNNVMNNDVVTSYIRSLNSNFDIELSNEDLYLEGFYYDKEYNKKYEEDVITGELELYAKWVTKLTYSLSSDGYYYIVTGCDANVDEVVIPEEYNGKSVREIASGAFMDSSIQSIVFSNEIRTIGTDAFLGCTNLEEVKWKNSMKDWCEISFENAYSNPMIYAKDFLVLNIIDQKECYEIVENGFISGPYSISNYSFTGFGLNSLIINFDHYSIGENAFYNTLIEEIYIIDDNYKYNEYEFRRLLENLNNDSIKVYRYIDNFRYIDEYDGIGYYPWSNETDYSGYWFNISSESNNYDIYMNPNIVINKVRYYKVVIDDTIQFVREGGFIKNIKISKFNILVGYYDEDEQEFDALTPIFRDYILTARLEDNPNPVFVEQCRVTLSEYDYNDIDIHAFVSSKEIYVDYGCYLKIAEISDENYELENIYTDSNYMTLFDFDTPITEDITLYPKYIKKLNCNLIYGDSYGGYAYEISLTGGESNLIIPSTYKGLPIVSIGESSNYSLYFDKLTISKGITNINAYAFRGINITTLVLPSTLKYVHEGAFDFAQIDYLCFDGYLADWLNIDFENENSNPITVSKNLYLSGGEYFDDYRNHDGYALLTSINRDRINDHYMPDFDNRKLVIKKYQFSNLEALVSICLDDFYYGIESVVIEEGAFKNCNNLNTVSFNINQECIFNINGLAFERCNIGILQLGGKNQTIEPNAFKECEIEKLVIMLLESIRFVIRSNAFLDSTIGKVYYNFDNSMFDYNRIYISSDNTQLFSDNCYRYSDDPTVSGKYWCYYEGEIVDYICEKIIVRFDYELDDLELLFNKNDYHDQYDRSALESIIEDYLRDKYESLYVLDGLYNNSLYDEYYYYFDISSNDKVFYAKVVPNLDYEYRGNGVYVSGLRNWQYRWDYENGSYSCLVIPESYDGIPVVGIAERVFKDYHINNVILPDSIIEICESAFESASIYNVRFSNNLETIGDYAFYRANLYELKLPNKLKTIGDYAFSEINIWELSLPKSVTSIGVGAFKNCNNLRKVYNKSSITVISTEMFSRDNQWSEGIEVEIPESVTYIDDYAFSNCDVRLIVFSNNLEVSSKAFGDEYIDRTYNIYIYPSTFTSNLNILNSKFRIFMYSSDYEEKRFGYWWNYNIYYGYMSSSIREIINM